MTANFIASNQLQPADVVVAKKRNGLGKIFNHYIVYTGEYSFMGNLKDGVKWISTIELMELFQDYEPTEIRRFRGTFSQRQQAINRAYSRLGEKYSLFAFNCEHYANWVQFEREFSKQVRNGVLVVIGVLILKLALSRNTNN